MKNLYLTFSDELAEKLEVERKRRFHSKLQATILALATERLTEIEKESE